MIHTNKILFLTLKVFAATGGIEKVCRVAGKAMYESTISGSVSLQVFSMYDKQTDADNNKYFPSEMFRGFSMAKIRFIYAAMKQGRISDTVVLSHVNLLLVGWLIKKISPSTKIIMFAHGIEVWNELGPRKRMMLRCCDEIISVSNFTRDKVEELYSISPDKCKVLNNCLDPFLASGIDSIGNYDLRSRYGFGQADKIIFTLTRLSSKERYKGYDKVLQAIVALKKDYPDIRYLLAGSYDTKEKSHLDKLIRELGIEHHVNITGFIPDNELVAHFSMADIYVMPSMKEGFGIVFIEAMYYGLPVIAGNKDGSVDALCNGALGILVDPMDAGAVQAAIEKMLDNKNAYTPNRELLMQQFSYETYKRKLEGLIAWNYERA